MWKHIGSSTGAYTDYRWPQIEGEWLFISSYQLPIINPQLEVGPQGPSAIHGWLLLLCWSYLQRSGVGNYSCCEVMVAAGMLCPEVAALPPTRWLIHSFCPIFSKVPWTLDEGKWIQTARPQLSTRCCFFLALRPVMSLFIDHNLLQAVMLNGIPVSFQEGRNVFCEHPANSFYNHSWGFLWLLDWCKTLRT